MAGAGPDGRRRARACFLAGMLLACLALAAAPAPSRAQPAAADEGERRPFLLTADSLTYDETGRRAIARGSVQIDSGRRHLLADEVTYDIGRGRVIARGDVVLSEEGGDTFFGREVELQEDLRDGFVTSVRMLREDDSRLAANRAVRSQGRYTQLDRAVYSPCPVCEASPTPLWQLKARRVVHDERARTVTYRDAALELLGVPVAYTPWFQHPDPSVRRQTGFLTPGFGTSSELGLLAEVPYHWVLAPNRDLTFAPIVTQSAGTVLAGEYRDLRAVGRTNVGGSLTYTDAYAREGREGGRGDELRGHVKADGRYPIASDGGAGFDVFLASDNSYLRRYRFGSQSRLENRAYVERYPDRDLLALDGYFFQGLREEDNQHRIPVVLPLAESRLVSEPMRWGSHWTLDSNLLALTRVDGLDTRRASTRGAWSVPHVGPIGDLYTFEASLRADAYHVEGNPETFSSRGGPDASGRVVPRATAGWSWPLVGDGAGWTYGLEPVATLSLAPVGNNPDDIPNEDSRDFEFDDTNLFEEDRFPGLDRVEGGGKLAYGLRFNGFGPGATQVGGLVGQSLRLYGSSPFPQGTGLDDGLSDYVGRLDLRPVTWADLGFRFRLDPGGPELRRSELGVTVGPSWLRVSVDYLNLSGETGTDEEEGFGSREEARLGARAQVTGRLALAAQTRRDLTRDAPVAHQLGLLYTHPCLTLLAGLERSFTSRGEVDDETTLLIRVALKNLGELQTGNFLGL